ncbi:hypothetical protein DY000_02006322 [Brassica cretica]|uniref:Uncharacterized protein n=1 Tax=Brassica cretica TaxID=69181 RepID=A0ABQ7CBX5_BRACR|nr:hypothetical protein DY000_02006322 [Brassica cretica]
MTFSRGLEFTGLEFKKARKSVGASSSFCGSLELPGVLVRSNCSRRSVGFERLRRTRRSHMLALSLSRRSLSERFGRSLRTGPLVRTRWDFRAFSVSRRSVSSELLPSSGSSFRLRTSLKSPGAGASSFSSSDDRVW